MLGISHALGAKTFGCTCTALETEGLIICCNGDGGCASGQQGFLKKLHRSRYAADASEARVLLTDSERIPVTSPIRQC